MEDAVTVHMKASPEQVWALVSDITRIGEFSPETFEAQWLGGATGPAEGAKFRGHVRRNGRGPVYWSPCTVTACVPGREFGFSVGTDALKFNNWHYLIEPADDGVDVTESFRIQPNGAMRLYWAIAGRMRGKTNRTGMQQTLERIKAVVEA